MSRVICRSIRPPARLYQAGPTEWTTPSLAHTPLSWAPKARASAPACGSPAPSGAGPGVPSRRRATTFVPGSRPATRAANALPSANVTVASGALGNRCSAATTTSFRQSIPETHPMSRYGDADDQRPSEGGPFGKGFGQSDQRVFHAVGHDLFSSSTWSGGWFRSRAGATGRMGGPRRWCAKMLVPLECGGRERWWHLGRVVREQVGTVFRRMPIALTANLVPQGPCEPDSAISRTEAR